MFSIARGISHLVPGAPLRIAFNALRRGTGLSTKQLVIPWAWLPIHLYRGGRAWHPLAVTLELTYLCNLRCQMCSLVQGQMVTKRGQRENPELREQNGSLRREMSTQEYLTLIADLGKAGVKRVAFTGGEPTLRADIVSLAEAVKKEGIALNLTTNATGNEQTYGALIRAGLDSMTMSFDGVGDVHDAVRGAKGSFARSLDVLRAALDAKRRLGKGRPRITVSCAVSSLNATHLEEVESFFQGFAIDHLQFGYLHFATDSRQRDTAAAMPGPTVHLKRPELPSRLTNLNPGDLADLVDGIKARSATHQVPVSFTPDLSRDEIRRQYAGENFTFANKCFVPWFSTRVDPWGQLYPCWIDIRFGDVRERPFIELWNSGMYKSFRKTIREGLVPKCATCCQLNERRWSSIPILRSGGNSQRRQA
jgi:MoaA/NifB/PqqE/SkfB family radical SAM enzyme